MMMTTTTAAAAAATTTTMLKLFWLLVHISVCIWLDNSFTDTLCCFCQKETRSLTTATWTQVKKGLKLTESRRTRRKKVNILPHDHFSINNQWRRQDLLRGGQSWRLCHGALTANSCWLIVLWLMQYWSNELWVVDICTRWSRDYTILG